MTADREPPPVILHLYVAPEGEKPHPLDGDLIGPLPAGINPWQLLARATGIGLDYAVSMAEIEAFKTMRRRFQIMADNYDPSLPR